MAIIVPTIPSGVPRIKTIREASAAIIRAAVGSTPAVHNRWKLRAGLERSVSLFKDSNGKIHGWMVGCGSITPKLGKDGTYEFIGARRVTRIVPLVIWVMLDYTLFDNDSSKSSNEAIENEIELVGDYFAANPKLAIDNATWIRSVSPFSCENLDVHSVSEGLDVHIGQCVMNVELHRY